MVTISLMNYETELDILERCHYEVEAHKNIIDYMIETNKKDTPTFEEMWEEYLVYLKVYKLLKKDFSDNIISKIYNKSYSSWEVNFDKKEVIIYE